ncbi:MAG: ribonucleotide reductase N-terminal alpha domain-containing protein, partial [Planctomycetota bacterium]
MFEIKSSSAVGGVDKIELDFDRISDSLGEKTEKIQLTRNAITVLERRYLKKDRQGNNIETPDKLFRRVACNVASAEVYVENGEEVKLVEEKFYRMISSLEFMPNSPTLMNAGRELQQLSACFVLPIHDAIDSIFEAVKNTALIHKSGGGTGFS